VKFKTLIKRAALSLAAIASLSACDPAPADGHRSFEPEYFKPKMHIEVRPQASLIELRRTARDLGVEVPPDHNLFGFAHMQGDQCVIYVVDPEVRYMP
jgi:hypothetical protein